jgi:hypothetical protein
VGQKERKSYCTIRVGKVKIIFLFHISPRENFINHHFLFYSYLGDMNEEQQECLKNFKEWIEKNEATKNPWHIDEFLLKFCRARKFDIDKVIEMFKNYMEYRSEHKIDSIIQDFTFDKEKAA